MFTFTTLSFCRLHGSELRVDHYVSVRGYRCRARQIDVTVVLQTKYGLRVDAKSRNRLHTTDDVVFQSNWVFIWLNIYCCFCIILHAPVLRLVFELETEVNNHAYRIRLIAWHSALYFRESCVTSLFYAIIHYNRLFNLIFLVRRVTLYVYISLTFLISKVNVYWYIKVYDRSFFCVGHVHRVFGRLYPGLAGSARRTF